MELFVFCARVQAEGQTKTWLGALLSTEMYTHAAYKHVFNNFKQIITCLCVQFVKAIAKLEILCKTLCGCCFIFSLVSESCYQVLSPVLSLFCSKR